MQAYGSSVFPFLLYSAMWFDSKMPSVSTEPGFMKVELLNNKTPIS